MNIAVVNNDQRMQEVYFSLSHKYTVTAIHEFTNFDDIKEIDVLVLPVKGIDEDGNITANGKKLLIPSTFWEKISSSCKIFAGLPHPFLDALPCQVLYYMQDENILLENAQLTAEGILFLLIDNTATSIKELKVDVIGYGRCGKAIIEWLNDLGIDVRIVRREVKDTQNAISVDEWVQEEPYPVIINTSEQFIMKKEVLSSWESKPLIIDIATPDVIDMEIAQILGIRVIKAGALPSMIAYKSAGQLIAQFVRDQIDEK